MNDGCAVQIYVPVKYFIISFHDRLMLGRVRQIIELALETCLPYLQNVVLGLHLIKSYEAVYVHV